MEMTEARHMEIDHLVHDDRVHARVYTDPAIFDLEMERIFGRTWVFVGHESQIPNAGDFITTVIGQQPIIISRTEKGDVAALFNRCAHRGSIVCREHQGNTRRFLCPYHGWAYRPDGRIAGIPYIKAYSKEFIKEHDLGLAKVPRLESYRGWLWASLAAEGPGLEESLGAMKEGIDNLLDRCPDGDIEITAGVHKYVYNGNWKMQLENGTDEYHPPFSHASSVKKDGKQMQRAYAASGYKVLTDDDPESASATSYYDLHAEIHGLPNGHSFLTMADNSRKNELLVPNYRTALEKRHGAERTQQIVEETRVTNLIFYPNLISRVTGNVHIRVIKPVTVDRTEVWVWPIRIKGAPEDVSQGVIKYSNVHASVSSFVQTDDLEVFERVQEGLQAQSPEWIYLARGLGQENKGPSAQELWGPATWEVGIRAQFRQWKQLMLAGR